ncbi:hypothetical protein BI364_08865 [Acidihalobacter yilgarnensis]|uniref:Uncharacterized protein n=1 Tax=Acidihalobacter yilgarnensis TaxID=2819280 RepID=A0A1D8IT33_9GAMM|nr:hypothetical protein BI364_08865 [Acidihalobacter yilgarnensis]
MNKLSATYLTPARTICQPAHLKRTLLITAIVGSWLTLFNLGDRLMMGDITAWIWLKVSLNYLTPFIVSNLGLLSYRA